VKKSEGVVMRGKNTKLSLSRTAFLFLCMLACVVGVASARTIYVPDDYERIQWAVDSASAGDTIIVRDGIYYEHVNVNKQLTLKSENGSANCIVDAGGSGSPITLNADGISIEGFTVRNSGSWPPYAGIDVHSSNNRITDNNISNNEYGIRLYYSSNNSITDNNILNNKVGIYLYYSSNNSITENIILYNEDVISLYYYGIYLYYSSNNSITDNNILNNEYGILLDHSSNNSITENIILYNEDGISFVDSSNNSITDNNISYNWYGIRLYYSSNNSITENIISPNLWYSIYLVDSSNNSITENIISYNVDDGIYLYYSSNNSITENIISNNGDDGIHLDCSNNNRIYLNNFIDNRDNVYSYDSVNIWNSIEEITYTYNGKTYTSYLGNYWSDYAGSDADEDGIGDTPYSINGDKDYYPLMERFENYIGVTPAPNQPPTASFTYTTDGLLVSFTSTSHDPDEDIVSYYWNFGDGSASTEKNPIHIYPASGKYLVTHIVEDSHGRTDLITKEIQVFSKIVSVSCPSAIAKGLPLHIEVETEEEASITASIGDFSDTKYGKLVEFNIDTSGFDTGEYELTINADGDTYKTSVRIFDAESYQEVIHGLTDLERVAEDEMHEISWMTGRSFVDIAYGKTTKKIGEAVLNKLCEDILPDVEDEFEYQLLEFRRHLEESGVSMDDAIEFTNTVNDEIKSLGKDFAGEVIETVDKVGEQWLGISGRTIVDILTEYLTEPVVYSIMCTQEEGVIDARTEEAKNEILSQIYTDEELTRMKEIISIGKEAIKNTDREKIYRLHIGTIPIVNKDISAKPTMYYFKESHHKSLNPGFFGFGKYNPLWIIDMTLADAQSVLTIPAELGWIEVTPENEEIRAATEVRPKVAFIPVIVGAVKAYIEVVKFVEEVSPYVISGGMFVSTDLLADEINEEHEDTINAILSVSSSMKSLSKPVLVGEDLRIPRGDIILTITPDGRIVDIDFAKADFSVRLIPEYKIVSLNAGKSYKIEAEKPNITLQLIPDKENYTLNQTANITLKICNNMDEPINGTLLWFFVPSENITIKDSLNLSANSVSIINYEFNISNETLHVPTAFLTLFDEILAEGHCSFSVGAEAQKGAVMTIDHKEFYDPGIIKVNVTVENVGNVEINPVLIFDNSSLSLPALQPKEAITKTVTFNFTEPGIYNVCFSVMEGNETFDARCIEFTVRAIDTLLAFPITDKTKYNFSELINVSVVIKNATLHDVNFPYKLEIITPSGKVINDTNFVASENGTYVVRASPIAPGYATIPGETLFMVERQSDLTMEVSRIGNATLVYIKTDAGGAVEGANVILNNIEKVTDAEGVASFEYLNATEFFVKAEKFGFNPVIMRINITEYQPTAIFDTGAPANPYPSIAGTHYGTITPNKTIIATKLYTYACEGTGGHTEYARIWNETWEANATWEGYAGDWHNISFDKTVVLLAGEIYFYEIRTGSYPQIHHTDALLTANGWINCTEFKDVNGRVYHDWIPAIKLF